MPSVRLFGQLKITFVACWWQRRMLQLALANGTQVSAAPRRCLVQSLQVTRTSQSRSPLALTCRLWRGAGLEPQKTLRQASLVRRLLEALSALLVAL